MSRTSREKSGYSDDAKRAFGFCREKAQDVALCEGEALTLRCLVAAEPKASIHWLKNDLIFMDDSRLKITTTDSGESTLVLDPAMPSDAGLYKVMSRYFISSIQFSVT